MALYLQDQINTALFPDSMKQDPEKQSPSFNNNNNNNNNNNGPMFPGIISPTATQPLSMSMQHRLFMASRFMASLPMFTNPGLFQQQQNLFSNWTPPVVSSPSPTSLHQADPVSPVINMKYTSRKTSNNNNSSTNNNNVVSSSADRVTKRTHALKRRASLDPIRKPNLETNPATAEGSNPQSPPGSANHEAQKDTRDRNFTCKICSRSFGYKHVLQNHERTHTGEKPFECPECHKRFTRDHHLKTHMRLHTGEKPYHCTHCDRQFVQVANLRRHLRVHTGERPYICNDCPQKFSDSNQLKAHSLMHKNEKPFHCGQCPMRFSKKSNIKNHKCPGKTVEADPVRSDATSPLFNNGDLKVEVDFEMGPTLEKTATTTNASRRHGLLRPLPSPAVISPGMPMPLNLSGSLSTNVVTELPEQTEPEDLSMSTGMHRPDSRSHSSGDSPLSRSPSLDTMQDDDEDELDVSEASPSSLFLRVKSEAHLIQDSTSIKIEPEVNESRHS